MPSRFGWLIMSLASILAVAGCSFHSTKSRQSLAVKQEPAATLPKIDSPKEMEQRVEAHAHFLAGLSYEQNRELDKALAEYEKALDLDARDGELAVELSRRYLQRKDYDK